MAYLTLEEFRTRTMMPQEGMDEVETCEPGFIDSQLQTVSALIDSRLRKRYNAPFPPGSVPEVVLDWLARIVTRRVYTKRGFNPSNDSSFVQAMVDDAIAAEEEMKEAADAKEGLYDLPLRVEASGIQKGHPFGYSEASPYVWQTIQHGRGQREDAKR